MTDYGNDFFIKIYNFYRKRLRIMTYPNKILYGLSKRLLTCNYIINKSGNHVFTMVGVIYRLSQVQINGNLL